MIHKQRLSRQAKVRVIRSFADAKQAANDVYIGERKKRAKKSKKKRRNTKAKSKWSHHFTFYVRNEMLS